MEVGEVLNKFIGRSEAIKKVFKLIEKVAKTDSTVLIYGESGTGKELVARAIHRKSPRAKKPLVPVNCGAIPSDLIESELFGYVKGAFTGAYANRPGRFEVADGGSIFLDEIGELPLNLQVKLLRVIQEKTFERVGDTKQIRVDVRIIAATNKDLEEEVKKGRFREDLYYRLNVIPIYVPPLRERREDIPLLVEYFLEKFNREKGLSIKGIEKEVVDALVEYSWPGNVRELENIIERMMVLAEGDVITLDDLPEKIKGGSGREEKRELDKEDMLSIINLPEEGINLKEFLDKIEEKLILQALERTGNVKERAARLLGLNRTTLVEKLKRRGLL